MMLAKTQICQLLRTIVATFGLTAGCLFFTASNAFADNCVNDFMSLKPFSEEATKAARKRFADARQFINNDQVANARCALRDVVYLAPSYTAHYFLGKVALEMSGKDNTCNSGNVNAVCTSLKEADSAFTRAIGLAAENAANETGARRQKARKQLLDAWLGRVDVLEAQGHVYAASVEIHKIMRQFPNRETVIARAKTIDKSKTNQRPQKETLTRALNMASRSVSVETPSVNVRMLFNSDSCELNGQVSDDTVALAAALSLEDFSGVSFRFVGHTDKRGDPVYNQTLSECRARTVYEKVASLSGKLRSRIRIAGEGETNLLYEGDDDEVHQLNRRLEIQIINQ